MQPEEIYYIKDATKTFEQCVADTTDMIKERKFGVLHVHDLGCTLRNKGQAFDEKLNVFEVCHPGYAAKVLAADLRMNMALPCRISVYTEEKGAKVKVGMMRPGKMLSMMSDDPKLGEVAMEVEEILKGAIDAIATEAAAPAAQ